MLLVVIVQIATAKRSEVLLLSVDRHKPMWATTRGDGEMWLLI